MLVLSIRKKMSSIFLVAISGFTSEMVWWRGDRIPSTSSPPFVDNIYTLLIAAGLETNQGIRRLKKRSKLIALNFCSLFREILTV